MVRAARRCVSGKTVTHARNSLQNLRSTMHDYANLRGSYVVNPT